MGQRTDPGELGAQESTGSPGDTVEQAATDVRQVVRDAAADLASIAKDQAGAAKEKAKAAVADAQAKASDQVRTAASALRDTANGLHDELPWMGRTLHKTADGLETLTSSLTTGNINDTLDAVTSFAKRQPALFIGLSVAAGFALARVGKTAIETLHPADASSSDPQGIRANGAGAAAGTV